MERAYWAINVSPFYSIGGKNCVHLEEMTAVPEHHRPTKSQDAKVEKKSLYRAEDRKRVGKATVKEGDYRTDFRRDGARLIHSTSFRRLQGKSQLFPSDENDFFRNRLTHSLEVAQIATGLAGDLNGKDVLGGEKIDVDLVHFAALAHDIGHPPFGHNGERALNKLMKDQGGFEGNAQSLRVLSKLEKKTTTDFPLNSDTPTVFKDLKDQRLGLNLTMRSLASVLKYDKIIKGTGKDSFQKGYYITEQSLVEEIKEAVVGDKNFKGFRTIECTIMDLADDIAYSTYDLEDALKSGFISAASMLAIDDKQKKIIIKKVNEKMREHFDEDYNEKEQLTPEEFNELVLEVIDDIFEEENEKMEGFPENVRTAVKVGQAYSRSCALADNGYIRTNFTSKLVSRMMRAVVWKPHPEYPQYPMLSKLRFDIKTFKIVEMLKRISYSQVIDSNRVRMGEYRGTEIIRTIFDALTEDDGVQLLPADWQQIVKDSQDKYRSVCDFISGMTDRYCLEFYSRLVGVTAPSIQKPY